MDRIVVVSCVVILVISYFDIVLSNEKFGTVSDGKRTDDDENKISPLWFSPRLGRRKRNSKDEVFKPNIEQELLDVLETLDDTPLAIYTANGNRQFICKNVKGKRISFDPRLERNVDDDFSENKKWFQDDSAGDYMMQRSPPFAPRLGRRFSQYVPRLGRDL